MIALPESLVQAFPPSADAFLQKMCSLVTEKMLIAISEADYSFDKKPHLKALKGIREDGSVPGYLDWYPKEVLELVNYGEPKSNDISGHVLRCFCGAALLRGSANIENEGRFHSENDTLVSAIESAEIIGSDVSKALLRFLLWRLPLYQEVTPYFEEEEPYFAFSTLILGLKKYPKLAEAEIRVLMNNVLFTEEVLRKSETMDGLYVPDYYEWQSFLSPTLFNRCHAKWRTMARNLAEDFAQFPDVVALAERIAND